jgi:hypothetical protein
MARTNPYNEAVKFAKSGVALQTAEVYAQLAIANAISDMADAIRELKQDFISIEVINDANRT